MRSVAENHWWGLLRFELHLTGDSNTLSVEDFDGRTLVRIDTHADAKRFADKLLQFAGKWLGRNGQPDGYHTKYIPRGVLGEASKIREELEELEDAEAQGNRIMAQMEASDVYRALELWAERRNLTMENLRVMAHTTKRAFENGSRA